MAKSKIITPLLSNYRFTQKLKNIGLIMLVIGILFLAIGCSEYMYGNSFADDNVVNGLGAVKIIIFKWLLLSGLGAVILGIWLVIKFD